MALCCSCPFWMAVAARQAWYRPADNSRTLLPLTDVGSPVTQRPDQAAGPARRAPQRAAQPPAGSGCALGPVPVHREVDPRAWRGQRRRAGIPCHRNPVARARASSWAALRVKACLMETAPHSRGPQWVSTQFGTAFSGARHTKYCAIQTESSPCSISSAPQTFRRPSACARVIWWMPSHPALRWAAGMFTGSRQDARDVSFS